MDRTLLFNLDKISSEEALSTTKSYFLKQGFKIAKEAPDTLEFKRGSIWLNMVTFNPLKWKSLIKIVINETSVKATFTIDAIFQAVTYKEERLWDAFIANYQKSIVQRVDITGDTSKLITATKLNSLKYIGHAFIGAVVIGIPIGLAAHYAGLQNFVVPIVTCCAVAYMVYKIEKDKKDNSAV